MSLYRTELRRLAKRRFTRWMTVLGLLILAAVIVGVFFSNHKIDAASWASAERQAEQEYQQQVRMNERARADCEQAKAAGTTTADHFPENCSEISPPPRDAFEARWYLPPTFDFRKEFDSTLTVFAAILALVGFVVGASFVGAEWNTGGMMNLLLWRPKRLTVLATKLAALLTGALAVALPTALLWLGGFWLIGTYRGSTEKMTSGAWQSFGLTGLRGIALVLVMAAAGFALASLGRHTAMALGGAIAVVVVGQAGLGILLRMAGVKFVEAWLLPTYLAAWMQQKVTLENWNACNFSYSGECKPDTLDITLQHSSILMAAGVTVLLVAAFWAMRRRDIS